MITVNVSTKDSLITLKSEFNEIKDTQELEVNKGQGVKNKLEVDENHFYFIL